MKRLSFKKDGLFLLLQNSILKNPPDDFFLWKPIEILKKILLQRALRIIISGVSSFFLFTSRQNQVRYETVKSAGFMFETQSRRDKIKTLLFYSFTVISGRFRLYCVLFTFQIKEVNCLFKN